MALVPYAMPHARSVVCTRRDMAYISLVRTCMSLFILIRRGVGSRDAVELDPYVGIGMCVALS